MDLADTPVPGLAGAGVQEPLCKVATSPVGPTSVQVPAELQVTETPTIEDRRVGATLQERPSHLPSSNDLEVPATTAPTATHLLAKLHETPYKWLLSADALPTARSSDQSPWWSTSTMAWA
jgi:hypothetical protein